MPLSSLVLLLVLYLINSAGTLAVGLRGISLSSHGTGGQGKSPPKPPNQGIPLFL